MRPPVHPARDIRRRGSRGLSLVELIVSMAVMSVLFLGMAGAMMLATRAIPTGDGIADNLNNTREVLGQLAEDLRVATHITEQSSNAVTFTMKDRNADGLPEVVRYAWSGVAGDPLVRKHNGIATDILANVHQFDLGFLLKQVTETYPGPVVTGSEVELSSHGTVDGSQNFRVRDGEWIGQYLAPALPADAISWTVTRVLFRAQADGLPTGNTLVQLRPANDSHLPDTTILEQQPMLESVLPFSHSWQEFSFSNVTDLAPTQALCLVLEGASGDGSCEVEWDNASGSARLETKDSGNTWTSASAEALAHYLYGTVVRPSAAQTLTREHVTTVKIGLQAGPDAGGLMQTAVQTLNLPEKLIALWEADFSADPTLIDLNADGVDDWNVPGTFDTWYLTGDAWIADGDLDTNPGHDFQHPTTADVRFRDIYDDGETGGIWLRVDRTGTTFAEIVAHIELDATGLQTLTVLTYTGGLNPVPVLVVPKLPAEYVDLRLLVDPDHDTCHVLVGGRDYGTFQYARITKAASRTCELFETADVSGLRFDWVRIRVGGTN